MTRVPAQQKSTSSDRQILEHMSLVFAARGLQGNEKLLLLAYLAQADENGVAQPTQKDLVAACGTSLSTVMRANRALISKGLISLTRRFDPETGDPIASQCRIQLDALAALQGDLKLSAEASKRRKVSTRVRIAVFVRDGNKCTRCGSLDDLTLDHIHPVIGGGGNELDNLRVLCRPCNSSKGSRIEDKA